MLESYFNPKSARTKIEKFISEKIRCSDVEGIVLGISGGLDSTTVAKLCKSAINKKERIIGIHLYIDKPESTVTKNFLNLNLKLIDISEIISSFRRKLEWDEEHNKNKIVKGNLIARIRMSILYYFANKKKLIVCGTSNKSEISIGYFTKYGDGGADILPIGDLYKLEVAELAKELEVPSKIVEKDPTAGLWEGQKDKKEIGMEYKELDPILYLMVEKRLSNEKIASKLGLNTKKVEKVRRMYNNSMHKREMPPTCKIH